MLSDIWEWLKGKKRIILHTFSGMSVVLGQLLEFMGVFDWRTVMEPKTAMMMLLGVNVLSIILGFKRVSGA